MNQYSYSINYKMNNNQRSIKKKPSHLGTTHPPLSASGKLFSSNPELKKLQNSLNSLNQKGMGSKNFLQKKQTIWNDDQMSQNYNFTIQEEHNLQQVRRQNKKNINIKEGNLQQPMSLQNYSKFSQNEQQHEEDINLWEFNFVEEMEEEEGEQIELEQYVNPYPTYPQQNQYYYINSESHQSLSSDEMANRGLSNINNFSISISSFSPENQSDRQFQESNQKYNKREPVMSEDSSPLQKQVSSIKYKFDNFFISIDSYSSQQQQCLNPQNKQTTNFDIFIKNFDYSEYLSLLKSQKHIQQSQSFVISSDPSLKQSLIQQQSSSSSSEILSISEQNKHLSKNHEKQSAYNLHQQRKKNASEIIKTKKERKLDKKLSKFRIIKNDLQNKKKRSKTTITSFPMKTQSKDIQQNVKNNLSAKVSSLGKFFNDLGKKRSQKNIISLPSPVVLHNEKKNDNKEEKNDKKEEKDDKTQLAKNVKKIENNNEIEKIQKKIYKSTELKFINKEVVHIQKPIIVKVRPQQLLEKEVKQLIKKLWQFKRPKELQYKLNNFSQSNKFNSNRSQLISCLLFNNVYFQNLGLKIPLAPKVQIVYENMEEYKRVFAANIRNEMYYEIRQKLKKIMEKQNKLNNGSDLNSSKDVRDSETQILDQRNFVEMSEQESECKKIFAIKIKDQEKLEREGMYQLNGLIVTNKKENKFFHLLNTNMSNYKSKYKLFLFVCKVYIKKKLCLCSVLCQIKEIRMAHQRRLKSNPLNSQQSEVQIGLIIGIDINTVFLKQNEESSNGYRADSILPFEGTLYDLGRLVTPIRQYQAVTNLKFNRLLPILLDPRTIHQDQQKFNKMRSLNTDEPYKSELNQLIQTTIKQTFNKSQYESIKQISEFGQGVQLLQGPPGTGKTSTLLGILSCEYLRLSYYNDVLEEIHGKRRKIKEAQSLKKNSTGAKSNMNKDLDMQSEQDFLNNVHKSSKLKNQTQQEKEMNYLKILVCTPSNSAIDLITSKILEQGLYQRNKHSSSESAEWSGLDIYKKLCKSINTINIEEKNKREIRSEQEDKMDEQISNIKNRIFPRILRIGFTEQEVETKSDHQKEEAQVQMKERWRDINMKPFKLEEVQIKYLDQKNFNLYYLLNSLFAHEMKNLQKYITNQQVRSKLATLQTDIKQIKSLILTIVRNFNELSHDSNTQKLRLDEECNCIINNLYNTFQIKTNIASSLKDILCNHPYFDSNKAPPPNSHNIKDVIKLIETRIICSCQILLTTLTTSYSQKIISSNPTFISLIVDEAAQCTEPNILIPLQYGINKVVLIGDHCQLPPTIKNPQLIKGMYSRSLFQRFWQSYSQNIQKYLQDIQENIQLHKKKQKQHFHRLNTQYRMDPLICQFPNQNFYQSNLATADSVKDRPKGEFYFKVKPVCFLDCLKSQEQKMCQSFINKIEGQCVVGIILKILKNFSQRQMLSMKQAPISIGIITPYSQQQNYIKKLLRQKKSLFPPSSIKNINVTVSTVDSYQGQERDIIIISTVRSNLTGNVGFLYDQRRINVALTRARYSLVVVGNSSTLSSNETWSKYIRWVHHKGTYLQYKGLDTNNGAELSQLLNQIFEDQRVSESIKMKNRFKEMYEKNIANFPIIKSQATKMVDEGEIIRIQRNKKRIFDRIDY